MWIELTMFGRKIALRSEDILFLVEGISGTEVWTTRDEDDVWRVDEDIDTVLGKVRGND